MPSFKARNRSWLATAAVIAVAAGAGFGVAKLTSRPPAPAAGPAEVSATASGVLNIPAAYLASAGIAVQVATPGSLSAEILAPATVSAGPNGEATITAHAAGTVTRLVKRLGDTVKAGELLATVESRDAAMMASDRSVADAKLIQAQKAAAREQQLFDQRVTPRQDLEAAQATLAEAQAEARRARNAAGAAHVASDGRSVSVVSPLSGRITAQSTTLGGYVQPDTELFRVSDPRFLQIQASVTGADTARIAAGNHASVITSTGLSLVAVVRSVTPTLDAQTRAATVVLSLTEGQGGLASGEVAQVRILTKASDPTSIVVPDEAVQRMDGRDVVFVRTATGFKVQPVSVGSRGGGRASILAGLHAGTSIATRNAFLLKAELGKGAEEGE
jgi:cobalt-zinc-cadmium efflux system membrane fusion protein